jgi:hypothetical protein
MRTVAFEEAKNILDDDTSAKGRTFLERYGEKEWRIVLPGECFIITVETFRELAREQLITADTQHAGKFVPA